MHIGYFSFAQTKKAEGNNINVIIIYPHFFENTRTLLHSLDSITKTFIDNKFFVYLSSEFNPLIYSEVNQIPDFIKEVSVMYGDLVPNFKLDEKNIRENSFYKGLLSVENIDTLNYFFFIPNDYFQHYDNALKKGNVNAKLNYLGIIPKQKISPEIYLDITIYFPKGTIPKREIIINKKSIKIKEI